MRETIIVGAGLSGLVAAINLARDGFRVIVRERRASVGGTTDIKGLEGKYINIGDGTPLDLERIRNYTSVDVSPAAVRLDRVTNHLYGKTIELEFYKGTPGYLFERGPRETSLDVYLYNLAVSEGVEFSFNDTVTDFDTLPADSIIASGLFPEGFRMLDIPCIPVYGYLAMGETDDMSPKVILYFDEFTRDYAFYSQVNGARGAVLFSRGKPLNPDVKDRFARMLEENDGITFDWWQAVNIGLLPVKQPDNPRLFTRNLILAGTISGTMDPLMLFGVHGALVSGKIAAIAVRDHQKALAEFERINRLFKTAFFISWFFRNAPLQIIKRLVWTGVSSYPYIAPLLRDKMFALIPGFGRI